MANAIHGRSGAVKVSTNDVAAVTGFSYDESADKSETTAMGDNAKSYLGGLRDGSGTLDCFWQASDPGHDVLLAGFAAGTTVELHLYPEGDASGKIDYNGDVVIDSVGLAQTKDDLVTISFQFSGFLAKDTIA